MWFGKRKMVIISSYKRVTFRSFEQDRCTSKCRKISISVQDNNFCYCQNGWPINNSSIFSTLCREAWQRLCVDVNRRCKNAVFSLNRYHVNLRNSCHVNHRKKNYNDNFWEQSLIFSSCSTRFSLKLSVMLPLHQASYQPLASHFILKRLSLPWSSFPLISQITLSF